MPFLPGLELCRRFHDDVVAPILERRFPGLRYAAGRLDTGSDVLGFDTPRSTDHDWGPRLQVFVPAGAPDLSRVLDAELPAEYLGWPVTFPEGRHRVAVYRVETWFAGALGFDPLAVTPFDWLATPTQRLAEATGGAVYRDDLGALTAARSALAWYPDDVWRYVLACQFQRLDQDEHLVGRCAEVGDDLGSRVLAARIVRELMRLCLLLDRRWPPYAKWLGSAYAALPDVPDVGAALAAGDWPAREEHLCHGYEAVARRVNATGLAEPVDPTVRGFHDRPYRVLGAARFVDAVRSAITDPWLRGLPLVGAIDQYVDSTDVLCHPDRYRAVARGLLLS